MYLDYSLGLMAFLYVTNTLSFLNQNILQPLSNTATETLLAQGWCRKIKRLYSKKISPTLLPKFVLFSINDYLDNQSLLALRCVNKEYKRYTTSYLTPTVCLIRGLVRKSVIQNTGRNLFPFSNMEKQPNSFHTFCYVPRLKMVITGDSAEYEAQTHPLNFWTVDGKNILSLKSDYFYKPIEFLSVHPEHNHLIAASKKQVQLFQMTPTSENMPFKVEELTNFQVDDPISYLLYQEQFIFIGTVAGSLYIFQVHGSDIDYKNCTILKLEEEGQRKPIHWIEFDSLKKRLLIAATTNECDLVKIFDFENKKCLHTIRNLHSNKSIVYSSKNNLLIAPLASKQKLGIWDTRTGSYMHTLLTNTHPFRIRAIHLDIESDQLFIALNDLCIVPKNQKSKFMIFNTVTGELIKTIVTHTMSQYDQIYHQEKSRYFMTSSFDGVQVWDIEKGVFIREYKNSALEEVQWYSQEKLFFIKRSASYEPDLYSFNFHPFINN
ncbi:MAG: hypothetical protein JWO53_1308 [Chlamydiia bacterium]|nr:hypothetical protein [Chlamydiia bacterium]